VSRKLHHRAVRFTTINVISNVRLAYPRASNPVGNRHSTQEE
jgi:hypothetical protein